ncbi:TPA: hypothetical protein RFS98_002745 [Klebsiella aerogenes]|uniref:HEPN domain-containing protein n=1 Tax=Klebsiella aerogenes TaxID=548 RepID=UPI0027F53146|nr:HEPN domain-containing protein [Klebsiella aerogenes]WPS33318.1 hypothetical protein SM905_00405 [Klebsiella aerogenes]HDU4321243.1 hypothetical protein [Klebsiella aerogenes]
MPTNLHFSIEKEYIVRFLLDDNEFYGKIVFNKNEPAYLEIFSQDILFEIKDIKFIICHYGNDVFHLKECKKYGSKIYPNFIIYNPPSDINTFKNFEISISELNILLNDSRNNNLTDEVFSCTTNTQSFEVSISTSDNIEKISDYWDSWTNIRHQHDVVTSFTQRHIISISTKVPLSIENIKKEVRHITLTFSLLSLIQLHINYVWLIHEGKRYPVYFPTMKNNETSEIRFNENLVWIKQLENCQWERIFNNSYRIKEYNELWSRFYGMLSYNSYWEYEFLGYMSILDYYLKDTSPKRKRTFKDRFNQKISVVPNHIKHYINLSEPIFKKLLTIRNSVAHCNPNNLNILNEISEFMVYKNRLLILLNYFILIDLGLTDKEYATHTIYSFNKIKLGACLETKWLAKIINNVPMIFISKDEFYVLKAYKSHFDDTIFIDNGNEVYSFDIELSQTIRRDRYKQGTQYESTNQFIEQKIITKNKLGLKTIPELHIHTEGIDDFIELKNVHILHTEHA